MCWLSALPEDHDVANIDISTVLLNDTVPAEPQPPAIGDYDNDAVPDLMVRFNRTTVSNLILSKGIRYGNVTLTATGELYDGTVFEGSDVIKVKMPRDVNLDGKVNLNDVLLVAKAICSHSGSPRWNPVADENEDNATNLIDFFIVRKNYGKTYPQIPILFTPLYLFVHNLRTCLISPDFMILGVLFISAGVKGRYSCKKRLFARQP